MLAGRKLDVTVSGKRNLERVVLGGMDMDMGAWRAMDMDQATQEKGMAL